MILEKGHGVIESEACGSAALQPGSAFAEPPKNVHKVDNFGPDEATIWWATDQTAIVDQRFLDNLSWYRGRHALKFGVEYRMGAKRRAA